jgi:hypothetical protein
MSRRGGLTSVPWVGRALIRVAVGTCRRGNRPPLAEDARPFVVDPAEGFVVSANEFNRGQHGEWWSTLPEPIYRWERLRQILGATAKPDMNTLVRASYDPVDLCAQRLMAVWKPLLPDDLLDDADARALADWAVKQSAKRTQSDRSMVGLFHALHYEMVLALLLRWLPPKSVEEIVDAASGILLFQYHIDQALALAAGPTCSTRPRCERFWPPPGPPPGNGPPSPGGAFRRGLRS